MKQSLYGPTAVERAMKIQEVILKATSGELTWIQAARIIGVSDRSMRRWKLRYENHGYDGLLDRRRQRPSSKRVPLKDVQRVLRLYRERYDGFNARHFWHTAQREHDVKLSYSFVKQALQTAGLVPKRKPRGRYFRRREPKPCFGEMLYVDGSPHVWLALRPDERQTLIASIDDATSRMLYGKLVAVEDTRSVMEAMQAVVHKHGIPMAFYTDRASWAFVTPKAGEKVDPTALTQVGRALKRLGVEHIPAYTPQARGRSERLNGTLQDRLVNELKAAGITSIDEANRFIEQVYLPRHNELFARPPKDPQSVFVSVPSGIDLDQIFCIEETRVVAKDFTVAYATKRLQLDAQAARAARPGTEVLVREHLEGTISIWREARQLGRYNQAGESLGVQEVKKATTRRRAA
jgi:transposase